MIGTGVYIVGGVVILGVAALVFYRVKWNRASKAERKGRSDNIEAERVEEEAKRKEKSEKLT
jgi:hypothetical protein